MNQFTSVVLVVLALIAAVDGQQYLRAGSTTTGRTENIVKVIDDSVMNRIKQRYLKDEGKLQARREREQAQREIKEIDFTRLLASMSMSPAVAAETSEVGELITEMPQETPEEVVEETPEEVHDDMSMS